MTGTGAKSKLFPSKSADPDDSDEEQKRMSSMDLTLKSGMLRKPEIYTGIVGEPTDWKTFGVNKNLKQSCDLINKTFATMNEMLHLPNEMDESKPVIDLHPTGPAYKQAQALFECFTQALFE